MLPVEEFDTLEVGDLSFATVCKSGGLYFRPTLPWRQEGGAMTAAPIPWQRTHPALRERTVLLIAEQMLLASPEYRDRLSLPLTVARDHQLVFEAPLHLRFSKANNRTSGLKWTRLRGVNPLAEGTELHNTALADALTTKTEFTADEFEHFGLTMDLRSDHYVKSNGMLFQPVGGAEARHVVDRRGHRHLCQASGRESWRQPCALETEGLAARQTVLRNSNQH